MSISIHCLLGHHAPHLSRHVVPLRCLEVVEQNEAALQEVLPQVLRVSVRHVPVARLGHVHKRMPEDLRIAQIEHVAAVRMNTSGGNVTNDVSEVTVRARVVVTPARAGMVSEAGESPPIVVLHVRSSRRPVKSELRRCPIRDCQGKQRRNEARSPHRRIITPSAR